MCNTDKPRITSYHEAGHAVMALMLRLRALRTELVFAGSGEVTGESEIEAAAPGEAAPHPTQILNRLLVCVAGMVAERRFRNPQSNLYNLPDDYEAALKLIEGLYPKVEPAPLFSAAITTVESLLGQATAWAAVEALAGALLERHRLLENEILDVIQPTGLLNRA